MKRAITLHNTVMQIAICCIGTAIYKSQLLTTTHWRRNRGGGAGGGGEGGQHPICPATFHDSPLSALPSVYQFISCHTLGSTALALVCVRDHFRVLENDKFSTLCDRETPPTVVAVIHISIIFGEITDSVLYNATI